MPRKNQTEDDNKISLNHDFELYTVDQVAELLGRHRETILRYIREGKLGVRKAAGEMACSQNRLEQVFGIDKEND